MNALPTVQSLLRWGLVLSFMVWHASSFAIAETLEECQRRLKDTYTDLDRDGQPGLSLDEYLKRPGMPAVLERNFKVFDFDADGVLSEAEFAAIPGFSEARNRGPVPSPFEQLKTQAELALDEAFGWDEAPQKVIKTNLFAQGYLTSMGINPQPARSLTQVVDPDRDGNVTRDEALAFLQQQLGLVKYGVAIRDPNGRVVNVDSFLHLDANSDRGISREEFSSRYYDKSLVEERFPRWDINGDGTISLAEFAHPDEHGWNDPVFDFITIDTDRDGEVNKAELAAGTPEYLSLLRRWPFAAFDFDGNGQLNLQEFCMLPQSNLVSAWQATRTDADRDRLLSVDEFVGNHDCVLLARLYFQRLDLDGSGSLSPDEYPFAMQAPDGIYRLSAAGNVLEEVHASEEVVQTGSPAVSPDGKYLAFDGRGIRSSFEDTMIYIVDLATGKRRELCSGAMPTWSADGKQLAISHANPANGISIVNLDGVRVQLVDAQGWGGQWSPDGRFIAFTKAAQIAIYDFENKESRIVLEKSAHAYRHLDTNMAWSPDSQRICFKGYRDNGEAELASVLVVEEPRDLRVHYSSPQGFCNDISWAPDGQRIYFARNSPEHKNDLLFSVPVAEPGRPQLVPGLPTDQGIMGSCCWSPDGKWLYVHMYFRAAIPQVDK